MIPLEQWTKFRAQRQRHGPSGVPPSSSSASRALRAAASAAVHAQYTPSSTCAQSGASGVGDAESEIVGVPERVPDCVRVGVRV